MLASVVGQPADAQDSRNKKQKRPKFGSSLEKLNWDEQKKEALEKSASADDQDEPIRLQSLLVTFDVLVVDSRNGRAVSGLSQSDFSVSEDGQRQSITSFNAGGDQRSARSIILIIDYSNSQLSYLDTSLEAARRLILQLNDEDEMAIVTDDVELLVDFTRDRKALLSGLEKIQKRALKDEKFGDSFQFTALFATLKELVPAVESRPIIIFQSDGDEAGALPDQPFAAELAFRFRQRKVPEYGLADIFKAAESSRATIYSVITSEKLVGFQGDEFAERLMAVLRRQSRRPQRRSGATARSEPQYSAYTFRLFGEMYRQGQHAGQQVAEVTGGWSYWLERADQADQIYKNILSDVNQRYVIGYYPFNGKRDGRLRKVRIEVPQHPHYEVHSRTTYRAPVAN